MSGFDFALQALQDGDRVRRSHWAAGCFVILVPGSSFTIEPDRPLGKALPHLVGTVARYAPHVDMCVFPGGVPTLSPRPWCDDDLLAEDWEYAT